MFYEFIVSKNINSFAFVLLNSATFYWYVLYIVKNKNWQSSNHSQKNYLEKILLNKN